MGAMGGGGAARRRGRGGREGGHTRREGGGRQPHTQKRSGVAWPPPGPHAHNKPALHIHGVGGGKGGMLEERSRRVARVGQGPPGGGAEGAGGAGPWLRPGEADRLGFLNTALVAPLPRSTPPPPPPSRGLFPQSLGLAAWGGWVRGGGQEESAVRLFHLKLPPPLARGGFGGGWLRGARAEPPRAFPRRERHPPRARIAPHRRGPGPLPLRAGSAPALFAPLPLCPRAPRCRSRPSPPRSPSLPSLSFSFE